MNHPFEKTITFNNAGAKHLERGDYSRAVRSLTVAFHSFKKTYNKNKKALPEENESSLSEQQQFNIDEWMRKMPSCSNGEEEVSDSNDDALVLVYHHPIRIPDNMEISLASYGLLSTAITFNLSLANHLWAIETKNNDTLRTAARLYEYGFSLERIRGRFSVSPFFIMAILNNLGSIHRLMEDKEKSTKCFRQLLSTLLYLVQVKGAHPSDLKVFFDNTSFGLSQNASRCAGAA
jgi:hypothetical protein